MLTSKLKQLMRWFLRELAMADTMTFGPLRPNEPNRFNVVRKDGDTYIVPRIFAHSTKHTPREGTPCT